MKILTLKEVKQHKKETLKDMLYKYQNLACNIDYIVNSLESDIIHKNISLIESVLIYKEY